MLLQGVVCCYLMLTGLMTILGLRYLVYHLYFFKKIIVFICLPKTNYLYSCVCSQVLEVFSKEFKGAISALASLQGHLLIASGPKIILHKWTGSELIVIAFYDVPPLHVVSLNIVSTLL